MGNPFAIGTFAGAVAYLASTEAGAVSGQALRVGGGHVTL